MPFYRSARHSAYVAAVVGDPTSVVPQLVRDRRGSPSSLVKSPPPRTIARRVRDALLTLYEWKSEHQYLGRYSVDKLVRFDHYCRTTSRARVAFVILATPLPVITILLVFQAVPLADPALGPARNWRLFPWSAVAHSLLSLSMMCPLKQALRLSDAVYPWRTVATIACFVGITNELVYVIPAFLWRFPVPYRELLAGVTWSILMASGHLLFARRTVRTKWGRIKKYLPIASAQFVLFFKFLGLAMVFSRLPRTFQFLWILAFPFFKIAMKRWLWQYSRRLDDVSTDVTVCLIEIAGALYQSVCMQLMESYEAALLLMAMDFAQTALEVWMYAHHGFIVDGASTVSTAAKIVESSLFPGNADERGEIPPLISMVPRASSRRTTWHGSTTDRQNFKSPRNSSTAPETIRSTRISSASAISRRQSRRVSSPIINVNRSPNSVFMAPADYVKTHSTSRRRLLDLRRHSVIHSRDSSRATGFATNPSKADTATRFTGVHALVKHESSVQIDSLFVKRKDQARILEQSLQLLFSCEVLIFVEYSEVMVPLIYTTIASVAWLFPNAKYNTVLCMLSHEKMVSGLVYSVGYALLELVTFGVLGVFVHRKFGVSTLYQLAFVLESYVLTIQGKLVGSFIVIVNLAIAHQGLDIAALTGGTAERERCAHP